MKEKPCTRKVKKESSVWSLLVEREERVWRWRVVISGEVIISGEVVISGEDMKGIGLAVEGDGRSCAL